MNIPLEIARAQGVHGIKGASHGIKGGRPRLKLTKAQRLKRRREQKRASRHANPAKPAKASVERKPRKPSVRMSKIERDYFRIWGKLPGEPLTAEDLAQGNARMEARAAKHSGKPTEQWTPPPQQEKVFVEYNDLCPCGSGLKARKCCGKLASPPPLVAPVLPGRNDSCPCGSGRKFKKCCGG
jgi:hypothetical protein